MMLAASIKITDQDKATIDGRIADAKSHPGRKVAGRDELAELLKEKKLLASGHIFSAVFNSESAGEGSVGINLLLPDAAVLQLLGETQIVISIDGRIFIMSVLDSSRFSVGEMIKLPSILAVKGQRKFINRDGDEKTAFVLHMVEEFDMDAAAKTK